MKNNKERTAVWLYPETMERLDGWLPKDNCKSRSEFIEKALSFYMGYLGTEDISSYLELQALMDRLGLLRSVPMFDDSNPLSLDREPYLTIDRFALILFGQILGKRLIDLDVLIRVTLFKLFLTHPHKPTDEVSV